MLHCPDFIAPQRRLCPAVVTIHDLAFLHYPEILDAEARAYYSQIAANALAAGFYPTSVRATGVGWALGIGRVGSIVGPLIGGALLSAKWSTASVFGAAAGAALCAALAAFSLSRIAGMGGSGRSAADHASFEPGLRPSTTAGG
ncbi:MAG: hypothetical protein NVS4B4_08900 [Bradyrhizobium sp.]